MTQSETITTLENLQSQLRSLRRRLLEAAANVDIYTEECCEIETEICEIEDQLTADQLIQFIYHQIP